MRSQSRRTCALAAVLAFAAVSAAAKPNFSGEWKLNPSKSDFGQMPAPSSMTNTLKHDDPSLNVAVKQSSDRGDFEWEAKYTTDGKECTNMIRDNPMKSVVKWDADTLLFDTKGEFGGNEFTMKDKWTVSADGKVLTIERHFSSFRGEGGQTLVFEKQ